VNFEIQNVVMQIFKSFLLLFKIAKGCHQDFSLLHTMLVVIDHFFDEKWLNFNVFSL
jgi:hypothetical protein